MDQPLFGVMQPKHFLQQHLVISKVETEIVLNPSKKKTMIQQSKAHALTDVDRCNKELLPAQPLCLDDWNPQASWFSLASATEATWPSHGPWPIGGPQVTLVPCGHHMPTAGQPRPSGTVGGKGQWGNRAGTTWQCGAPSCTPIPLPPQQGHSWQQSRGASEPPQPLFTSAEVPRGAWGTSPTGSWQWGSARRAAHPTAGTRDIFGKLRWPHFSECHSPTGSSIHWIWGLISSSRNHETVNTSLHPSESLMDT